MDTKSRQHGKDTHETSSSAQLGVFGTGGKSDVKYYYYYYYYYYYFVGGDIYKIIIKNSKMAADSCWVMQQHPSLVKAPRAHCDDDGGLYYCVFDSADDEMFHGEYLYTYITMFGNNPCIRMLAFRDLTAERAERSEQSKRSVCAERHIKSALRRSAIESRHVPYIPQNQFYTLSFESAHYTNPCIRDIAPALEHERNKRRQLYTLKTLALYQLSTRELSMARVVIAN